MKIVISREGETSGFEKKVFTTATLVVTKVSLGDEALALLRSWHEDGAFGGHKKVPNLSKALHKKLPQTPDLLGHVHLTSIISGELARIVVWIQFTSVPKRVSESTLETSAIYLISLSTTEDGHCAIGIGGQTTRAG